MKILRTICAPIGAVFKRLTRLAGFVFNLRFLSARTRNWLFVEGTRPLEFINGVLLLGWGLMTFETEGVDVLSNFGGFTRLPYAFVGMTFLFWGTAVLVCMPVRSKRWNILSGFFMEGAGVIWFLIAVALWHNYPPFNISMLLYSILAILNWWAGEIMIDAAKGSLDPKKGE